jgi:hypothetical protein
MLQAVDKKSDLSGLGFSVEEANLLNMSTKVGPALQVLFAHASIPVAVITPSVPAKATRILSRQK